MRISDWSSDVCSSDLEIERADAPQPNRRSEAELDEREQDQHEGGVFDEIAVRAHPAGEEVVAAVADEDFLFRPHAADTEREPQVEQRRAGGDRQADRQDYHIDRKSTRLNSSH